MSGEASWERTGYQSRVDALADQIEQFVEADLRTIDAEAARESSQRWAVVCRFFAGAALAARAQWRTPAGGGTEIAAYLSDRFPWDEEEAGATQGFEDFMDWLSDPQQFEPTGLRAMMEEA